jgi:hypothetical protein
VRGSAACKVSRATRSGGRGDIGRGTYVQRMREGCWGVDEEEEVSDGADVNKGDSLSACQRSFCRRLDKFAMLDTENGVTDLGFGTLFPLQPWKLGF